MRRRDLLRAVSVMPLTKWLGSWSSGMLGQGLRDQRNAAVIYRSTLSWAEGLRPVDLGMLRNADKLFLEDQPDEIAALVDSARSTLASLREAAQIARCDWQREILTHDDLGKGWPFNLILAIIGVAFLSARRHAASGRGREALDDAFAGLTLAHRLGSGGLLIDRLLECAGEGLGFQTLGHMVPRLGGVVLQNLSRRLDVLPSPEPASAAIAAESRLIVQSLRAKLMAGGPMVEGEAWNDLGLDHDEAATLQRQTGGDRTALLAQLDASGPAFDELGRRLDLPRPACRAALDEFIETARSTHPIVVALAKNAWSARHVVDRMLALRAMLRAGLAFLHGGESAFREIPDCFGAGPFGFERWGNGYAIYSALNDENRSQVVLAFDGTI